MAPVEHGSRVRTIPQVERRALRHWRSCWRLESQLRFRSRRGRATERSGVARALETKFLLFRAGQRQDSVPPRGFLLAGTAGRAWFSGRPPSSRARCPTSPAVKAPELSL